MLGRSSQYVPVWAGRTVPSGWIMTVVGRFTYSETAYCHGSMPYRSPTAPARSTGWGH